MTPIVSLRCGQLVRSVRATSALTGEVSGSDEQLGTPGTCRTRNLPRGSQFPVPPADRAGMTSELNTDTPEPNIDPDLRREYAPGRADRRKPSANSRTPGSESSDAAAAGRQLAQLMSTEVTGPESFPHRSDDGLFGPGSVAWKLFVDPSAQIGMVCAVLLQALNPNMMRLFDNASHNKADPEGRAKRTGQYVLTTVFGDTEHAHAAGAAVSRLHSMARWTDPSTGDELCADTPAWLEWTHNAIVWGVLRASDLYGPSITAREQDRFVAEMHAMAELVGIDTAGLPSTRDQLDAEVHEQSEWMALTLPAAEAAAGIRHTNWIGNPLKTVPAALVSEGISTMMPDWAKDLYGIREGRARRFAARSLMKALLAGSRNASSVDERLRSSIADADEHPYRRTKAEREAAHHAPEHRS